MKKWTPIVAVLAFVAGVLACDNIERRFDPPDLSVPEANAASLELTVQEQDSFVMIATWKPVVHNGDTIREYLRETGLDTGTVRQDTIQATRSETVSFASPAPGTTVTGYYCLRSVIRASDGSAVVAPDTATDLKTCRPFQYTSPLEYPPPPDSLDVGPGQALTADSVVVYPRDSSAAPGEVINYYALIWSDHQVIGCAGAACNQIVIVPATWSPEGVPVYLAGAGSLQSYTPKRLPWLRELPPYHGTG